MAIHIFHGGCLSCTQQEKHGINFCYDCQFFDADWNKPNLSNSKPVVKTYFCNSYTQEKIKREREEEQNRVKRSVREAVEGLPPHKRTLHNLRTSLDRLNHAIGEYLEKN